MKLPNEVREVLGKIKENNEEAYLVGGAVRNYLLGLEVNDYDIATSALPEKTMEIFKDYRLIDIGKKFGTIILIYKGYEIEITSFRTDGTYLDGRRPKEVYFSKSLKEDLSRRDFTINALAYGEDIGLVDYFKGLDDLKAGIIRTVGEPRKRFEEDYLRILRAIRFASVLDFEIEEESLAACLEYGPGLSLVSPERIRDEFFKILLGDKPSKGIELLKNTKILEILFPEISKTIDFNQDSPYHSMDVYRHSLAVLDGTAKDLETRLAALFHDLGKIDTKTLDENGIGHFYGHQKLSVVLGQKILRRLNSPRNLIDQVSLLIDSHMINNKDFKNKGIKRLLNKHGEEGIFKLFDLQKADRLASSPGHNSILDIVEMEEKTRQIIEDKEIYEEKQLVINGRDVIELGYKEGKIIGEILAYILDKVLEDGSLNEREKLIEIIEEEFNDRRE